MNGKYYVRTTLVRAYPQVKGDQPGYAVVYPDDYVSWCPKEAFEAASREITTEEIMRIAAFASLHYGVSMVREQDLEDDPDES